MKKRETIMKTILLFLTLFSTTIFNLQAQCVDPNLIDPTAACIALYDPVCGCDGKTYANSCSATIEGGVISYTQGICPPTETYTICAGQSVEIGLPRQIGNTILTWSTATDLSCSNCPNPIASPSVTTTYQLTTFTTIGFTTEYAYYEVIVDENCPCEEGEFPEPTYLYTIGTDDEPQSSATAVYSWSDVVWTDNLCSWFWDFGNGQTSTDANPQEVGFTILENAVPLTEPYNICLTVTDCNGTIEIDCCEEFYPLGISKPICALPPDVGPCDGICQRWYYDNAVKDCLQFDWGCCDGNANNFETYSVCIDACEPSCDTNNLPWLQMPVCDNCYLQVQVIEYNNQTYIAFWEDNNACSDAISIVYNCDGSVFCYQNGFAGFQQCNNLLANFTVIKTLWDKNADCDACFLPPDAGICQAAFLRYFYNSASENCEIFSWGGCGGNANNYTTFEACMAACGDNGCPLVIDLGATLLNTASYQAQQQIIFGGNINANQQVNFKANKITIENGFTVPASSEFKAHIGACD